MLTIPKLRSVIGDAPEAVPLNDSVLERVDHGDYEQLKVAYDVEAGERISAYLLIPRNRTSPAPALYCHHQHAGNFEIGKSEVVGLAGDPDQALAPKLAKRGFIVLAPDALAFEERNWSNPSGYAQYVELTTRLVKGRTLLAKVLHDVSVGLDFLCAHQLVDKTRLGFIGHSYGGRMAIWSAAFDDRIKASVSHCGCVTYAESLERDVGIQAEFCVPGILKVCDVEDIVRLVAPRALYISATSDDKYSRGAERIFESAKSAFPQNKLVCRVWEGGHIFSEEMRHAAYRFLSENLCGP